jgi:hypothetical protein
MSQRQKLRSVMSVPQNLSANRRLRFVLFNAEF